jgi:hypothetical protein
MTDEADRTDPELVEKLADLEKSQQQHQRWGRRTVLAGSAALGILVLLDLGLVFLGGGKWLLRDVIMVVGLGALGMSAWYGNHVMLGAVMRRDADLLDELRNRARMATMIEGMVPLLRAINEAHSRGAALVVPPPGDEPPDWSIPVPPRTLN